MMELRSIRTGGPHGPLRAWTRAAVDAAIDELAGIASWLPHALAKFDDRQIRQRPAGEEGFSLVEHVWHLRDIDAFAYLERVRRTLAEHRPDLPDVKGDRLAVERRYNEQPLEPVLDELLAERRRAVEMLRDLDDADLARDAVLEGAGPLQLGDLLLRWSEHDREHRVDIEKLAASLRGTATR